ncbi:unnamed protein product [Alopecurus aequalis]
MAVSVTTGVLSPLLGKLTKLLGDEYKNLTGLREQASFLRDELIAILAPLEKLELMDKLDPSDKAWRDHVREMSYDMENCIDDFMRDIEGVDAKGDSLMKMIKLLRRLVTSHHIANRVEELKIPAVESKTLPKRYTIDDDDINPSRAGVVVDPRISAIYMDAEGLVGMDGPREELISLLTGPQQELKVVFIVGSGGLGKTTLAMKVWFEIERQFNCTTFVSVCQRPDVESLLSLLLLRLGIREFTRTLELHEIIDLVRECLEHERYFILVDDIWDQSAWNIIRRAFPENSYGSRLIVTTRLDDVAVNACQNDHACIYRMKPLEERDTRRLFFKRVFGSENECPPQFQDISAEILKKCGGLPLAIITIASLLAHEAWSLNEWKSINNSFGAKFATKSTLEEMRGILNLSYMHLPIPLRPCLLYLGMYPEDNEIWKGDLIKQWVAEGFICSMNRVDLYDVAESYFNELINRSLIMPERTEYGEILSCRVHDMMRDLILSKSFEDNFISLAYKYEDMEKMHSSEHKVRRLSLKSSADGAKPETLATSMSQVRSYAQFSIWSI